ncbi:unnamed protein product [Leptosia nina]|uniref:Uncharacterized protein n=1 Tax=Leptosia nina TaxID=320188 RepID=A0AAV1JX89_9NEOP
MTWKVLLLSLAAATTAFPVDMENVTEEMKATQFEKELLTISYIQDFKKMMSDYVKSQYTNLTINDMEIINNILEEFLQNFGSDLHKIIVNGEKEETPVINDGIPDSTFDDVKKCVKNEIPDINDDTADQIVFKLRENLFKTRQKLDDIIRMRMDIENSN